MKTPFTLENRDIIESVYLDQVAIRNNSKFGSKKFTEAEKNIDAIESAFSILVFGTTDKSFSECLEQLDS
jgi:CO dehydrogenase/acetyl-CoA synthase gamma subunit (corrinoid Fe-S protein)